MIIKCFSISSNDQLDKVYILLNSVKQNKKSDTVIQYSLFLNLKQKDVSEFEDYFSSLISEDFKIDFIDWSELRSRLDWRIPDKYSYAYMRCFVTEIFEKLNKILYFDTDIVFVREGIEQLWNTDIEDYYLAAVEEPLVTYVSIAHSQLQNTKSNNYFNTGVMLFNLKRMRDQQVGQIIVSMVQNWDVEIVKPLVLEQSLLNYYLKEKVKLLDYKFNNSLLVANNHVLPELKQFLDEKCNGVDFQTSVTNAVVYHFLGQNKPWKQDVRNGTKEGLDFAFSDTCIAVWDYLEQRYKKPE